ncbi:MAG: hypothetical protein IJ773_14230 [Lachnospiraceae bacterium]|nr:hypothetical protein [Lachnospiraceae bacterium]
MICRHDTSFLHERRHHGSLGVCLRLISLLMSRKAQARVLFLPLPAPYSSFHELKGAGNSSFSGLAYAWSLSYKSKKRRQLFFFWACLRLESLLQVKKAQAALLFLNLPTPGAFPGSKKSAGSSSFSELAYA